MFPPHTSSPPDERQQGNATILNELWQTRVRVGRAGRISWSCLLPALKEASSLMRCFCSPRASPKATERFCCWRGGTCGWDIFIPSSLPSLSVQNKSQLVKWERRSQGEKDSPARFACHHWVKQTHATAVAQLHCSWLQPGKVTGSWEIAGLLLDF